MNIQEKIFEKIRENNNEYIIIPSPNFIHRKEVEESIKNNEGYCCCSIEKTPETMCICKEFRDKQASGFCHCERYYKIKKCKKICLCGSTKFKEEFNELNKILTLKGYIVEMPGVFMHQGDNISDEEKIELDELHKSKIADCDLIFIINKDGYIGQSTKSEIDWAKSIGKEIVYLEN